MQEESGDPQRVLRDVMGLLADGTIVPEAGALSDPLHQSRPVARPSTLITRRNAIDRIVRSTSATQTSSDSITSIPRSRLLAGQKFSIEDIDQVKKGVMGSREPGRGGKFFIEG